MSLSISNPGSGVLASRLSPSAPWLKLSRRHGVSLGSDLGTQSFNVTVRGVASSIPAGTHTATIKVESLYPSSGDVVINVSFRVFELPEGTLLGDSGVIYVMRGGLKRHIPTSVTFEARGFDPRDIVSVPGSLPPTIPSGDPILDVLADGNLVKGSGSAVYVMEGGVRRHITSPEALVACGYGWDAVYVISESRLGAIATGDPVTGPPCPHLLPADGVLVGGRGRRCTSCGAGSGGTYLTPSR